MDAAMIELIKAISTDAIKILGPAAIAAYAMYRATQSQLEAKLTELDKAHEFGAREHLFKYYKDRQAELTQHYEQLNHSLGNILGFATGYVTGTNVESSDLLLTISELIEMYSRITPAEINTTARDMEQSGLKDTVDYKKLTAYAEPLRNLEKSQSLQVLRSNIFSLMVAYHFLQQCNHALMQQSMEKIFVKYVNK